MVGILLVVVGQIFAETATSIGKYEVAHKKESLYAVGFLSAFWGFVLMICIGLFFSNGFTFSIESLPTFALRAVLEVILLFVSLNAVLAADRSTFSFLRTLTIPLLLIVDISLGYALTNMQIAGMCIITAALALLFFHHDLSKKGKLLSVLSAMLAVCTISLYKYDITHFNSVEAEQSIIYAILLVVLLVTAKVRAKENVMRYLLRPLFLFQSLTSGVAHILFSFAYLYAPASIISTAVRSSEVLISIASGRLYFREKHMMAKLATCALIIIGIGSTVL